MNSKTAQQFRALISAAILDVPEANKEHFKTEALDHLNCLRCNPEEADRLTKSLKHRITLHKSRNMYLVPPMLFPLEDESDADHKRREYVAGGFLEVDFQAPQETVIFEKGSMDFESLCRNEAYNEQRELGI